MIRLFIITIGLTLLVGCFQTQTIATDALASTIDVSVIYRERMMLPPGSQLEVTLNDVSKMDVAAEKISSVTHDIKTGPPYNVSLSYNEDQILSNHRYSLRATITNGGKLMFINTYAVDPFASEERPVEIITEKVSSKPAKPNATLENTRWRLLTAKGIEITMQEGQEESYLLLEADSNRARGFSGCNNFSGSYQVDGSKLSFSQVATTMKMCPKGMENEQMFQTAINETTGYELAGENLKLVDGSGAELAIFKAIYLQ